MPRNGYHGRILHVDLTGGGVLSEGPGDSFYRLYPGPALMGTWFLLREPPPGIDAFAPENVLTFACGVAGGNLGTGLARFGVVAKSPLSGGVFESRGEGPFARGLKGSGFDALVIRGKAAFRT